MENSIVHLIEGQLPEHIQESTPLFKEFIVTYYRYASHRNKSIGKIQNNSLDTDIDETTDQYISNFYDTYAEFLPKEVAIDQRNFIKFLNKIYESKGTEKSLKLIFKLLFNDTVKVSYPVEQILRASGGKWIQENYITVSVVYGRNPLIGEFISLSNDGIEYQIIVSRILKISPTDIRIYYKPYAKVSYVEDQLVYIYDDMKKVDFIGQLRKSPSKIKIKTAGAGWQNGQIIVLKGTISPTIAKVTSINDEGGVTGVEVLDHGYIHAENQFVTISPYPNKPSISNISFSSELGADGNAIYVINIEDGTEGASEEIIGISQKQSENSYFLELYTSEIYAGDNTVSIISSDYPTTTTNPINDTGLTMAQYLYSRATFYYETDFVVKEKGYYEDDTGKISNQEVKIQDNYFYQAFSYVMETTKDISEYLQVLNITHPAGTKRFSKVVKESGYTFNVTSERDISVT